MVSNPATVTVSIRPTATVTTTAPDPTNTFPIPFTVTFNEDVTGFSALGLTVTNGVASPLPPTDARTYGFVITPATQGAVTVTVKEGAAQDAAGTGNLASNTLSRVYDTVPPTVTVYPLTTDNPTPTLTGTVNDPAATVSVTVNGQTLATSVTGGTWSAAVTDPLANGSYTVQATATDTAGNQSAPAAGTLVVDTGFPLTVGLDPASDTGVAGNNRTEAATVTLTGLTQANANLTLVETGATTTAAADGSYSFTGVPLALGSNTLNVTATVGTESRTVSLTVVRNSAPTVAADAANDLTITAGTRTRSSTCRRYSVTWT